MLDFCLALSRVGFKIDEQYHNSLGESESCPPSKKRSGAQFLPKYFMHRPVYA